MLPIPIYMFNVIPIKIPVAFCPEIEKAIMKYERNTRSFMAKDLVFSQSNCEQKLQC
jgi:hypothetical protein